MIDWRVIKTTFKGLYTPTKDDTFTRLASRINERADKLEGRMESALDDIAQEMKR